MPRTRKITLRIFSYYGCCMAQHDGQRPSLRCNASKTTRLANAFAASCNIPVDSVTYLFRGISPATLHHMATCGCYGVFARARYGVGGMAVRRCAGLRRAGLISAKPTLIRHTKLRAVSRAIYNGARSSWQRKKLLAMGFATSHVAVRKLRTTALLRSNLCKPCSPSSAKSPCYKPQRDHRTSVGHGVFRE